MQHNLSVCRRSDGELAVFWKMEQEAHYIGSSSFLFNPTNHTPLSIVFLSIQYVCIWSRRSLSFCILHIDRWDDDPLS